MFVVNLKRRTDRRERVQQILNSYSYTFFEAVDGRELRATAAIARLFRNNDFGSNPGAIGCALSHYTLWRELIEDDQKEKYIILEDDITVHGAIPTEMPQGCDLFFFGATLFDPNQPPTRPNYMGGTFAYMISKNGARKICDYIAVNGIAHGIDYLMVKKVPGVRIEWAQPFVVTSPLNSADTDIQRAQESLDLTLVKILATCNWCSPADLVAELNTMMGDSFGHVSFEFVSAPPFDKTLCINLTGGDYNVCWEPWHHVTFTCAFWQITSFDRMPLMRRNRISIILSQKYTDPGHKWRVDMIRRLEDKCDIIDVFGRENYHQLKSYKGQVTQPKEYYINNYNYYLAVENHAMPYYISEKFWEPILCETMPIYFGCTNITDLLPSSRGLQLATDVDSIIDIVASNRREEHIEWLRETKAWILRKHNLFEMINKNGF